MSEIWSFVFKFSQLQNISELDMKISWPILYHKPIYCGFNIATFKIKFYMTSYIKISIGGNKTCKNLYCYWVPLVQTLMFCCHHTACALSALEGLVSISQHLKYNFTWHLTLKSALGAIKHAKICIVIECLWFRHLCSAVTIQHVPYLH